MDTDRPPRNARLTMAVGIVVAVAFGYGLVQLFVLRMNVGDAVPPYSTLRADPVGAKAIYESLERLPGIAVRRSFRSPPHLEADPTTALLCFGTAVYGDIDEMEEDLVQAWEGIAAVGGRVVLAFLPLPEAPPDGEMPKDWDDLQRRVREEQEKQRKERQGSRDGKNDEDEDSETDGDETGAEDASEEDAPSEDDTSGEPGSAEQSDDKEKNGENDEEEEEKDPPFWQAPTVSLAERWGVTCKYSDLPLGPDNVYDAADAVLTADEDLPGVVPWHAALYFCDLDERWRTIYECDGDPVVIERRFGTGSIVLSSDSYYFSNEAMAHDRFPRLLAWMVGSQKDIVFEEYLKGVREEPGVMTLARRYRLHGMFAGLLVLALLFIWRNSASLVPHYADDAGWGNSGSTGKGSAAGLVSLLRRSVPQSEVLEVCFREWRRSFAKGRRRLGDEANLMATIVRTEAAKPYGRRDPVGAYQAASRILAERGPGRLAAVKRPAPKTGRTP